MQKKKDNNPIHAFMKGRHLEERLCEMCLNYDPIDLHPSLFHSLNSLSEKLLETSSWSAV